MCVPGGVKRLDEQEKAMNPILRKVSWLIPLAALAAGVLAAAPALAAISAVSVSDGQLVAKGVEVDLSISFTCTAGDTIGVNPFSFYGPGVAVTVQQAINKTQQASGFAQMAYGGVCTGSPQSILMQVLSNSGGPPFRVGPAVVSAQVLDCDATGTCLTVNSGPVAVRFSK